MNPIIYEDAMMGKSRRKLTIQRVDVGCESTVKCVRMGLGADDWTICPWDGQCAV